MRTLTHVHYHSVSIVLCFPYPHPAVLPIATTATTIQSLLFPPLPRHCIIIGHQSKQLITSSRRPLFNSVTFADKPSLTNATMRGRQAPISYCKMPSDPNTYLSTIQSIPLLFVSLPFLIPAYYRTYTLSLLAITDSANAICAIDILHFALQYANLYLSFVILLLQNVTKKGRKIKVNENRNFKFCWQSTILKDFFKNKGNDIVKLIVPRR